MASILILIANDLWLEGFNRTMSACVVDWQRCKLSLRYVKPLKTHTSCHADMNNFTIWQAKTCNLLAACRAFDCFVGKVLSPFHLLDTAMRWKHFRVVPTKLPMWQIMKSLRILSPKRKPKPLKALGKSTLNTPTHTRAIRAWKRREFPQLPHQKFKHFTELESYILQWNDLELSRSRIDSKKILKSGEE